MTRGEDLDFLWRCEYVRSRRWRCNFWSGRFQAPLISTAYWEELDVWARQWGDDVDCQGSLVVRSGLEWSLKIWISTRTFGASSFGLVQNFKYVEWINWVKGGRLRLSNDQTM